MRERERDRDRQRQGQENRPTFIQPDRQIDSGRQRNREKERHSREST